MTGRYIGDNIRSILEVRNLAADENLHCIIISIDFEKNAFATICWKYLEQKCLTWGLISAVVRYFIFNNIFSCSLKTR